MSKELNGTASANGLHEDEIDDAIQTQQQLQAMFAEFLSPATLSALSTASVAERLSQIALQAGVTGNGGDAADRDRNGNGNGIDQDVEDNDEGDDEDVDDDDDGEAFGFEDDEVLSVYARGDIDEATHLGVLARMERDMDRLDAVLSVMERTSAQLNTKMVTTLEEMRRARMQNAAEVAEVQRITEAVAVAVSGGGGGGGGSAGDIVVVEEETTTTTTTTIVSGEKPKKDEGKEEEEEGDKKADS